jgi:AhpD family alkylhydroperoxidase
MSRIAADEKQIRNAYEAVCDDPQWTESCRLIAEGKPPSEMFQAMAVRPDILRALSAFGTAVYPGGLLERGLKERVVVAVSEANHCQYCVGSHTGTLHRLGLAPDSSAYSARENAALAYTRAAVANPPFVSDDLWRETREHFTEEEIVELTLLIGLTGMLNRFNDCLNVHYNNDYE